MNIGDKVKILRDIPSINGMLRKGTTVRVDNISLSPPNNIRVVDDLGKIWFVNGEDIRV